MKGWIRTGRSGQWKSILILLCAALIGAQQVFLHEPEDRLSEDFAGEFVFVDQGRDNPVLRKRNGDRPVIGPGVSKKRASGDKLVVEDQLAVVTGSIWARRS